MQSKETTTETTVEFTDPIRASSTGTIGELMTGQHDHAEDKENFRFNNVSAWTENLDISVFRDGQITIGIKNAAQDTVAEVRSTLADLMAVMDALKGTVA